MTEKAAPTRYIRTEKLDRRKHRGDSSDEDAWYDKKTARTVHFPTMLKHDPNRAIPAKRAR